MFGKKVILLAASILALSLWGCSADFEAENNQTSGEAGTAVVDSSSVGAANCIGCHEVLDIANSTTVVADYLAGKHVIHSIHVDAASECALACHDPFGDGRSLESFIEVGGPYDATVVYPTLVSPTGDNSLFIPENGLAAVTCETCHGAGGDHVNGAAIPYKTPDYNRCGQCHNSDFFHRTHGHTAEEDNIVEDYTASKHFSGAIRNSIACVKCHTDAGARLYKDIDALSVLTLADALPVAESNSIQCRTCHDPHNNGKLLKPATASGSAEYNTCTNCHQRHDATINAGNPILQVTGTATSDGSNGDLIFHAGSWDRVISSTHWDDPATNVIDSADQLANKIEGYAIDPLNERACRDCHNVHGADATINKQWASSAHGSKIRDAKEAAGALPAASPIAQAAAVRAAGANGADHALPHYDWDDTGGWSTPGDARGFCQKCHTATGAKNYLNDPANYNPLGTDNKFDHLDGWVDGVSSSGQNELLYCWACHSDNSGALRNPGAITLAYTVDTVNPTLPDLGKSNVCVNCHAGLGNMDSYTDSDYTITAPATDMTLFYPGFGAPNTPVANAIRKQVTASHYFTAAAVIFQANTRLGYEYGLSYADQRYYGHNGIGLNSDSPETGSGPCATCHMTGKNHSLDVVEKDGTGAITALKGTICITCHDGEHALFVAQDLVGTTQNIWNGSVAVPTKVTQQMATDTALELEHEAEGFHEALEILRLALDAKGLPYDGTAYPYFSGGPWGDEGTFGAGHNYVVLHHEPGAFAHNRFYAKRLIFDSIDWLDGDNWDTTGADPVAGTDLNNLDGIINIDVTNPNYAKAVAWLGAAETADPTATPPVAIGDASRP